MHGAVAKLEFRGTICTRTGITLEVAGLRPTILYGYAVPADVKELDHVRTVIGPVDWGLGLEHRMNWSGADGDSRTDECSINQGNDTEYAWKEEVILRSELWARVRRRKVSAVRRPIERQSRLSSLWRCSPG